MQFNYWGDNFYHSSGDRIEHADPTEMKRVAFMAAAAMYYLSTAGAAAGARPGVGGGGERPEVDRRGDAAGRAACWDRTPRRLHERAQGRADEGGGRVRPREGGRRVGPGARGRAGGGRGREERWSARLRDGARRECPAARGRLPRAAAAPRRREAGARRADATKEREYDADGPAAALQGLLGRGAEADAGPGAAAGWRPAAGRPAAGRPVRRLPGLASKRGGELHRRHAVRSSRSTRRSAPSAATSWSASEDNKFAYVLSPRRRRRGPRPGGGRHPSLEKSGTVEIVKLPPPSRAKKK